MTIKLPKTAHLLAIWAAVALSAMTSASADTVILKSGIKHEGTLISETADSIRFEVGKTATLVRTFKRSEIDKLVVIPQDEIALPAISALIPTPDFLDAGDYSRMIDGAPKNFIRAFPNSSLKPQVEKVIATLEAERQKVFAGGIKVDGEWITKEQIAADRYNHDARMLFAETKKLLAEGETLDALRKFSELEEGYPDSFSYPTAITTITEILPKHIAALGAQLTKTVSDKKRRDVGLSRMLPPERLKAEAAYQEQLAPFLKRYAAEKAAKERWIDYHVWDVPSITNAQTEAKSELARLQKLDHAALATRADALQQAAQLAAAGNYEKASLLIKDMGKIPSGSRAATLKQTILDGSRAAAKKDAEEKASAERKKRMAAREAAAAENAAALAAGKQKPPTKPEKTTTEPVAKPTPKPKPEKVANNSDADPEDSLTMDDDGVAFDRTAGESAKSGSGFKFTTLLMVLIPIMAIATFLTLKMAKNNEVEDFVPEETEDESDTTPSL